jgi:Asp/Glu/hydantoin racemase
MGTQLDSLCIHFQICLDWKLLMTNRTVAIVHTSFAVFDVVNNLMDELLPQVERIHIIEHSILSDILTAGGLTPGLTQRMLTYYFQAEGTRAEVIFSVCSTVGDVVDIARKLIAKPIVKIDEAMVIEALNEGQRIGVLATLPSTLNPTCRLVENLAADRAISVNINRGLVDGAFDELMKGNASLHDQMVEEKLRTLASESDTIILAQASMARVIESLDPDEIKIPVLSSPRRGVLYLKSVLESLG